MNKKKRNISVRLSESDICKIKDIAHRFGVKESELFRYAVKSMLTKLMPFNDGNLRGADLIPVWLECGEELLTYFHIDSDQLDTIFNDDLEESQREIESSDLDLMILSNLNEKFIVKRLSELCGTNLDHSEVRDVLKKYLYEKYILNTDCESPPNADWNRLLKISNSKAEKLIS